MSLGADECGAADNLECTTLGWTLLYGWMILGLGFTALVVWRVARGLQLRHKLSPHDALLVGVLALFWLVAFGVIPQPLDAG